MIYIDKEKNAVIERIDANNLDKSYKNLLKMN